MKTDSAILDRDAGKKIDLRDGQPQKASSSISRSFDPDSNVTDVM
jgi:hypothetical protein